MKKALKFLNALLFLAAFGVSFIELVRLAVVNASLIDLIKLGFGKTSGSAYVKELVDMVQESVRPLAMAALALVVLMWLGVILSVVLRRNAPYICGLVLAVIQAAGVTGIYFGIDSKLEIFRQGLDFFGLGSKVKMYSYTLIIWLVIYVVIVLISIVGIVLKEKSGMADQGPIMEEQFHAGKNPWAKQKHVPGMTTEQDYLAKIQELEREQKRQRQQNAAGAPRTVKQPGRVAGAPGVQGVAKQPGNVPGAPGAASIAKQPGTSPGAAGTAKQSGNAPGTPPQSGKLSAADRQVKPAAETGFNGAIVGQTGEYASKAYMLGKKQQVFFEVSEGKSIISELPPEQAAASVYYIEEYKEYCVDVMETKSVFLKSGQPLGKGRTYYLPRGTEIYIKDKKNRFTLA